ncbi:MAG TPA: PLP-dependent aminotransferase family protein, partial [Hyphomicrobiaceae bacterium]|nr:PLP-dependent aminotransferase family protein [Hyphomicrobiaceae bacterium]
MTAASFDVTPLLAPNLPPAIGRWTGYPKYNFVGGHNDHEQLPVEGLVEAANAVLQREGRDLAWYTLQSGPLGYRPLREFLVAKLARDAGIACSSEEILLTSGSLQAMDLVNTLLLSRGDTVVVEQANYGGTLSRLARLGVNAVGIPLDSEGMRTDALATALQDLAARGIRPKYIYTIPTVQNPTGTVLSAARRTELLALSRRYGVPIFEDDCYSDLVWAGTRPPALYGLAGGDGVI